MLKRLIATLLVTVIYSASAAQSSDGPYRVDFGKDGCGLCNWIVVVDGVMGGLSDGRLSDTNKTMIFDGTISLANNGGFASVRNLLDNYDLNRYKTVSIRYRSTGQNFDFVLYNYRAFFRPVYKSAVPVTADGWQTLSLSLRDFRRSRLGKPIDGTPSDQNLETIIRFGLITADKNAGKFHLEIDYIEFE